MKRSIGSEPTSSSPSKKKRRLTGSRPAVAHPGLGGLEVHEELALVVAGAARVDPLVLVARLERRADPLLERVGRLDVVVAVDEDRGGVVAGVQPLRGDDRMRRRLVDLGPLDADARQLGHDPLRRAAHLARSAPGRRRRSRCGGSRRAGRDARRRGRGGAPAPPRWRRRYRSGSSCGHGSRVEPIAPDRRLRGMRLRFALGVLLAMASLLAPTASGPRLLLHAGRHAVAATLGGNEVVLLGTVVDAVEAPAGDMGQQMAYAVEVERSSQPVAATVEVRATFGDGGASCGVRVRCRRSAGSSAPTRRTACSRRACAAATPWPMSSRCGRRPRSSRCCRPSRRRSLRAPAAVAPEIPWGPIGLGVGALLILAVTVAGVPRRTASGEVAEREREEQRERPRPARRCRCGARAARRARRGRRRRGSRTGTGTRRPTTPCGRPCAGPADPARRASRRRS